MTESVQKDLDGMERYAESNRIRFEGGKKAKMKGEIDQEFQIYTYWGNILFLLNTTIDDIINIIIFHLKFSKLEILLD